MGIWIGRYAIVDGDVQEHGPRVVERPRIRDDDSVHLLVLAEPVDARSDEFCGEIANAVAEMFARESASLTGGLLRALRQAHSNLEEWNRRSLREHGVAIGLTCVAIRNGVATIAQVGPGIVYISGPSGLERLSTEGASSSFPIGGSEPVDPQFHLRSLSECSLLLLGGDVEHALTPAVVGQVMLSGPERALAELFVQTRGLKDVTAVLIAELDGFDVTSSTPTTVDSETETHLKNTVEDRIDSGASNAIEGASSDASKYSEARSRGFPSLRRPRIVGRRSGPVGAYLPWRAIGIVLVAVIVIAAAGRFTLGPILEQDRGAQLSEAVAAAELHLAALPGAPTVALRRSELEAALTEISRARSLNETDIRVIDLGTRAAIALEALDAVVEVDELRILIEFSGTITAPFEPTSLISGGGLLWLLDSGRGRVFAIGPVSGLVLAEVYRSGEVYEGLAAYDPISITWDETGSRLLVLDTSRKLFSVGYTSTSGEIAEHIDIPRTLILRGADELLSVTAIATYSGNLYLLDSQDGEVWRYLPAGNGYDSERSPRLGGVDIEDTYGLMVDGDLWLLGDGGLHRFSGAVPPMALFQGIDHPLESPVALSQDDSRGLIYVADRSAHRLVSSSSKGEFVSQFRHNEFFDLRGLTLSSDGSEMYVLTGNRIVSFDPIR